MPLIANRVPGGKDYLGSRVPQNEPDRVTTVNQNKGQVIPTKKPSSSSSSSSSSSNRVSSGSSSSGSSSSTPNYYAQLMSYYQQAQQRARDSAISALNATLNSNLSAYDQQLEGLGDEYQKLRNQSEVERYKAMRSVREALANRGQLDSGYGRQETLNMNTEYGNAINNINMQEQKAREQIELEKQRLRADYEAQIAQLESSFANNILSLANFF